MFAFIGRFIWGNVSLGSSTAAIPSYWGSDDLKRANDTPFPAGTQEFQSRSGVARDHAQDARATR